MTFQKKLSPKAHKPHDEIYGPMNIPDYCWPFIDTPEFQRLRFIPQLATAHYVFPSANHTRFEHSLGCAHLASTLMEVLQKQEGLGIEENHKQSVVIAALCHDVGHGPWSHSFEYVAHSIPGHEDWDHEKMSVKIMNSLWKKYQISELVSREVINAASCYIQGKVYYQFPVWLSTIVCNQLNDIDIDKFDYIVRDMTRTLGINRLSLDRLLYHCKVIEGRLCWRKSEVSTIDQILFSRHDLHKRVYQHKTSTAISLMVADILLKSKEKIHLNEALNDWELFCKMDDRILAYIWRNGDPESKNIINRISTRDLYHSIGTWRFPKKDHPILFDYFKKQSGRNTKLAREIAHTNHLPEDCIRVQIISLRYGIDEKEYPLKAIPFYAEGTDRVVFLESSDISMIVPSYYVEMIVSAYVTESGLRKEAEIAFKKWREEFSTKVNDLMVKKNQLQENIEDFLTS